MTGLFNNRNSGQSGCFATEGPGRPLHYKRYLLLFLAVVLALGCDPKIKFDQLEIEGASQEKDWLMLGRNPQRQHFSPEDIQPPLKKIWDRKVKSVITDHPLALGNYILATTHSGILYLIDYETGNALENGKIGPSLTNVPTIDKSRLFMSFEFGHSTLMGLDLLRSKRFLKADYKDIQTALLVVDNLVIFGTAKNSLRAVNANSGQEIWQFDAGAPVQSSPAAFEQTVVIANTKGKVFALDVKSGVEKWSTEIQGNIMGHAVLNDESIFLGTTEGTLTCLTLETGKTRWQHNIGGAIFSSPSLYDQTLYIGHNNREVLAIDQNSGEVIWRFLTNGIVNTVPLPSPNYLYVTAWDRNLYVLDRSSGEVVFKEKLKKPAKSSPIIYRDLLLIHTANDRLTAYSHEQFSLAAKEKK